jgi:hypothetical protein
MSDTAAGAQNERLTRYWTTRRCKIVREYVAMLAGVLRLSDWEVRIDFDTPADDDAYAMTDRDEAQKTAVLMFGAPFLPLSQADKQQTLVHELVHFHLFDLQAHVGNVMRQAPEAVHALADAVVSYEVESSVNTLAGALTRLVPPLPPACLPPAMSGPHAPAQAHPEAVVASPVRRAR